MHYQTDSLIDVWQVPYHCDDGTYIIKHGKIVSYILLLISFTQEWNMECSTAIFTITTIYFYQRQYTSYMGTVQKVFLCNNR